MTDEPKRNTKGQSFVVIGRRDVLFGALLVSVSLGAACTSDTPALASPFQHGIASGDPLPDAVILWTRLTPQDAGATEMDVAWAVAEDAAMERVVAKGDLRTNKERDFTVKVDARGLAPGRTYYYRFTALGVPSRVGRTKTAPRGPVDRLRFALVSCSSLAHGHFHGYREIAQKGDLDAVVHLGDYIYEYGSSDYGDVRPYEPANELVTLADYRTRHAQYKRDPDLAAVHRQHPFVVIWDDHEIANDGFKDGAQNHNPPDGSWTDRKAAAMRAYMEWMPIREQEGGRIYRKLSFGDLADLVLLDTRYHGRTVQARGTVGNAIGPPPSPDPARTLLGDDQAAWMEGELQRSTAQWKLLGQQVMVANLTLDVGKSIANLDQWHGYPESRKRFMGFLRDANVKNVVVLTGDIHSSWANELADNPHDATLYDPANGKHAIAVEIVTPGITSPGIPALFLGILDEARPKNPHIRWVDGSKRGFVLLDVTRERVQAAWYHFEDVTITAPQAPTFASAWAVRAGETRLFPEERPATPREGQAPPVT